MLGRLLWRLVRGSVGRLWPWRRGGAAAVDLEDVENPETWHSLDYVHDQVQAQLTAQAALWESVDGRLRLILGLIGIVFAATAAVQRGPTQGAGGQLPLAVGVGATLAVVLFLLAAIIVAVAYWPANFDRPPNPAALRQQYLTADARETKLAVIDSCILAYNTNQVVIQRKNEAFKRAFLLTAIATVLLGVAFALQTACQTADPGWRWWGWVRTHC
ncbi:MAG: hypothetical protein U0821_27500 [Chloroflexota bacterium]